MTVDRIVVVGAGAAGHSCAFALRRLGYERAIDLIGSEGVAPYDRTLLSKEMLLSDDGAYSLSPPEAYADADVRLLLGVPCVRLSPAEKLLFLGNGTAIAYDRVILCTGGSAMLPQAMNAEGVLTLRDLDDAAAIRLALARSRRVVVVGCGFIGGEVATAAVGQCAVTIVEAAAAPFADAFGSDVGSRIVELHRSAGVEVITGTGVRAVSRERDAHAVALADGRVLHADAVVVGVGMSPATHWLGRSSVALGDGILTDERCETAAPDVFAAGDCARWPNARYGGLAMRIEHWDTARRHGATAAANALGAAESFAPLPYFWSDQHGLKLQWVGHAPRWDSIEIDDDSDGSARFVARYSHEGRLVGVMALGRPYAIAAARRELVAQAPKASVL